MAPPCPSRDQLRIPQGRARRELPRRVHRAELMGTSPVRVLRASMTPPLLATRMPGVIRPGTTAHIVTRLDTAQLQGAFHGEPAVHPVILVPARGRLVFRRRGLRSGRRSSSLSAVRRRAAGPWRGKLGRIDQRRGRATAPLDVQHLHGRVLHHARAARARKRYRLTVVLPPYGTWGAADPIPSLPQFQVSLLIPLPVLGHHLPATLPRAPTLPHPVDPQFPSQLPRTNAPGLACWQVSPKASTWSTRSTAMDLPIRLEIYRRTGTAPQVRTRPGG